MSAASRPPLLDALRERARQGSARQGSAGQGSFRIALPEAQDVRVLRAAAIAWREGLCVPILVGDAGQVRRQAASAGVDLPAAIEIADPALDLRLPALTEALDASLTARKLRVLNLPEKVRDPLYYADLLVLDGRADGAVMGALATTSDTLRAALRVIGVDPEYRHVTSCFLMVLPDGRTLIYADCGVIPQPNAEQLADIARQAAATYRLLVGGEPKVALLAFSTKGSANHPALEPIRAALELLHERGVDFEVDGELQADAALVPEIGRSKAPGSPVAGAANVLVFPDLNSGNIAYKLTERLAQASAIGPLLRGLARPIHDLSRGCSVDDIVDTVAITALDAARHASSRRTP